MSFRCDAATLERLEWPRLAEAWARCAATERGEAACRGDVFAATRAAVAERLAETGEARALIDAGEAVPFGGIRDLRPALEDARLGRSLSAASLGGVLECLRGGQRVREHLLARRARAPRLADLAATLPLLGATADALARVVTPEGEVRDDASPELARARRRIRELESECDRIMARARRDPDLREHLQDDYVTSREDRPVLPVRAQARHRVRGIVHGVSSSGTTLFIEPEAAVDAGNRLRIARTEAEREVERLLRQATAAVRERALEIEAAGATLEVLDVALARGRLSLRLDARAPELCEVPTLELRELRHPLLLLEAGLDPDEVVPSDLVLESGARCLVISGPNAGGKTVAAKAVGLAALALRAGLHVPCGEGSRVSVPDVVRADIGDAQDLRAGLSTFSARMRGATEILGVADASALVVLDEIGEGTEPGEGAALAQALLEALVDRGATVVATTHFNRLKELAGDDPRFANASAEFDLETLAPTYRIFLGAPGSSGAMHVARRMGLDAGVVERARALLDREDRKLEALTRSLSELRQDLEVERRGASQAREQSEAARAAYEQRMESLRRSREAALEAMRGDLDDAFRAARDQVAGVVRDLQRAAGGAGGARAGREANRARDRLAAIERRTGEVAAQHAPAPAPAAKAVRTEQLVADARVEIAGVPGEAVIVEPPDRRGSLVVRAGGARLRLDAARVSRVLGAAPEAARPGAVARYEVERSVAAAPAARCDLRGLRVDEAIDRAEAHLQAHLGRGSPQLIFVHGHGTGALRDAVRGWLRDTPQVAEVRSGGAGEGGNGVTVARLEI